MKDNPDSGVMLSNTGSVLSISSLQALLMITAAYSQEERNAVQEMDLDAGLSDNDIVALMHLPPPGEEGLDLSHEAGEHEVFDGLVEDIAKATG